jgi:hypothetical protein
MTARDERAVFSVELTKDEGQLLIACLTALERELSPDHPINGALNDLREFRSRLLQEWLRHGIELAESQVQP